jgi:pimeloyl-ACP methyl ester carboxylesterase
MCKVERKAQKSHVSTSTKGYKVIAVDSRSQGKTIDTSDTLSYKTMADDMNGLLDALRIDSANVIGWSDGGINGLLLAINHPEKVKKLAITGANLTPDPSVFDPAALKMLSEYKATPMSRVFDVNPSFVEVRLHDLKIAKHVRAR